MTRNWGDNWDSWEDVLKSLFEKMEKHENLFSSSSSDVYIEAMLEAHTIAQTKLSGCRPPLKLRLQTVINSPPQQNWLGIYVRDIFNIACSVSQGSCQNIFHSVIFRP